MVFQEPMTSLNPVLTIGRQLELAEQRSTDAEQELALVYEVDEKIHQAFGDLTIPRRIIDQLLD